MDIEGLVTKAQRGTLATNDQNYQTLVRQAGQGVQQAKNALERINQAGGARSDASANKVI